MAGASDESEQSILRNEEALRTKYEENDKITRKCLEEIDEMKSRLDGPTRGKRRGVGPPKPTGHAAEFCAFLKIVGGGGENTDVAEHRPKTEITVKNYVLQKELDRANGELARAEELCDRLRDENRRLTEERDRDARRARRLEDRARERDAETETLAAALKVRDAEVARLLKELDAADRRAARERAAHEKRAAELARVAADNGRLADAARRSEAARAEAEERRARTERRNDEALAKCARERDALVAAFRKQLELIDVLKRRQAGAALCDELTVLEREFGKLLESQ